MAPPRRTALSTSEHYPHPHPPPPTISGLTTAQGRERVPEAGRAQPPPSLPPIVCCLFVFSLVSVTFKNADAIFCVKVIYTQGR